jgi:uncharacterized protein
MKTTQFEEVFALDSAMFKDKKYELHQTKDGYLVCMPRIARTGIQEYLGAELGRADMAKVRIYRPEGEVFSKDAVKSLAGKPVTIEHPDHPVTADTWKQDAVGYVGTEILRDGEFIRVPIHLMDAAAVNEVKGGRAQLSVGYTSEVLWGDGVSPSGEPYHAMQTAIRANHVAITHTARGGPKLRMGDNDRRKTMATKKIMVDGIEVELEERDAQLVERRLSTLEKEIGTLKATGQTELANATAVTQTKDAEIATLKQQLADATISADKLDALADARAAVKQRAKALFDSVILDKKTDAEIRRQVVNAKLGDVAKDWNDDMVSASFNTLTITGDSGTSNGLNHVVQVIRGNENLGGDQVAVAYNTYSTDLSNRWKTAGTRNSA